MFPLTEKIKELRTSIDEHQRRYEEIAFGKNGYVPVDKQYALTKKNECVRKLNAIIGSQAYAEEKTKIEEEKQERLELVTIIQKDLLIKSIQELRELAAQAILNRNK